MIISHRWKLVFVHVHKTAGDSITEAVRPVLGPRDFVIRTDLQRFAQFARLWAARGPVYPELKKHSTAAHLRAAVGEEAWASYFTFAVVRDPVSRAISLYRYALRKSEERVGAHVRNLWYRVPAAPRNDPMTWPAVRAARETSSFAEFLRHPLVDEELGHRPQSEWLFDEADRLLVDYVGRFETLREDFARVSALLGLRGVYLGDSNASAGRTVAVTDEDRRLLYERFARDYRLLGYGEGAGRFGSEL